MFINYRVKGELRSIQVDMMQVIDKDEQLTMIGKVANLVDGFGYITVLDIPLGDFAYASEQR